MRAAHLFVTGFAFLGAGCTIEAPAASPDGEGEGEGSSAVVVPEGASVAESYCLRTCLDADRDRCLTWASNHSDAFLRAYETCGNDVTCLEREVLPAPRTAAATSLAASYCAECTTPDAAKACEESFYDGDTGVGWAPLVFSDAKLGKLTETCLADRSPSTASAFTLPLCQVDLNRCVSKELPSTSVICRPRPR